MAIAAFNRRFYLGVLLSLPVFCFAQTESELLAAENELETVYVVSESENDKMDYDTVNTSRISAKNLTEQQAKNIKDMVRYEPGVSVTNNPSRFGLSGFNIRGLEENRILMQVDGVRLSDSFVFGGYSNASRDMIDIELLESVEIQRGTGSLMNGSDALGGVVSYVTPRPEDILGTKNFAGTFKSLYQSVDDSADLVATGAAGNDIVKFLVRGVWRSGQESETRGNIDGIGIKRTKANPQVREGYSALAKFAITPSSDYRAEFGYQKSYRDIDTHLLSGVVGGLAKDMNTNDKYLYEQWSIDQSTSSLGIGNINLKLYLQKNQTWQYTRQDRKPTVSPFSDARYERYFDFQQENYGIKLNISSQLDLFGQHLINWGLDWSITRSKEIRDGYTNLKNGTVKHSVTVDDFPTRDFPPSKTQRWAIFAQDEWFLTDTLTINGGGRFESYRLDPKSDSIYLANKAAAPATGATFRNFSPKIGAIWHLGGGYSISGQYAYGFRAPPFDDVNIGFANFDASYTAVANPNLKEETSRGLELSLRHTIAQGNWSITAFDNHYRNFIESTELECPGDPACDPAFSLTFQSQNIPKVRIYGIEAKLTREFLPGWVARGSFAFARGRNVITDEPIYSINPASGNLGLIHIRGPFLLELSTTFADKKREEDAKGSNRQFLSPGYAVVDFRASWNFDKNSMLSFGAYNIFNKLYYHWADIPVADIHIPDSQAGPERYSQPGRNFALTFNYTF